MIEVLQSPSHFSSSSSSPLPRAPSTPSNDVFLHHPHTLLNSSNSLEEEDTVLEEEEEKEEEEEGEVDQVSLLELLVTLFRKSWVGCNNSSSNSSCTDRGEIPRMEIGLPTNVRHVAHVTFDRFNGFLGLPVEFEPEVPRRPPSASASVFGVSTESMQLSFDSRGNSVPIILLLMQNCLYAQGGLQAEGIFRINADNSQEEYVRDQLNRGLVPDGVDIHCLAGLIKAWFRELPTGVLDSLSPEQVMQSQSEEECAQLARLLPSTEAALLDWAINLMADVAQLEHLNKMNARNVAMVFAPNMTHLVDPLTALMYAVQVMNFLKTLIMRTLRERHSFLIEAVAVSRGEPSDDDNGHQSSSWSFLPGIEEVDEGSDEEQVEEPASETTPHPTQSIDSPTETTPPEEHSAPDKTPKGNGPSDEATSNRASERTRHSILKPGLGQSSLNLNEGCQKLTNWPAVRAAGAVEKSKGSSIVSRINSSRTERIEAW